MSASLNHDIANRLDEVAQLLGDQGADRFRVQAYRRAAETLRHLTRPVSEIFAAEGLAGLESIPQVGSSIARAIRDLLQHGQLALLERLRGRHDPVGLLRSVPGIGRKLAAVLHDDLGLSTLADLEAAAHDGRLETFAGVGRKRLAAIRDTLAHRLARVRPPPAAQSNAAPSVAELLEVDEEYRAAARAGKLPCIAPRRFNPTRKAWLPVLHTTRGGRHYTAMFSNTARAHELGETSDWVVLYFDGNDGEGQNAIITARFGSLKGRRIVRGRETECVEYYDSVGRAMTGHQA